MTNPIIATIIQARMGSSRLPGKVLLPLGGAPVLAHVVARASRAETVQVTLVATTDDPADDPIQTFCEQNGYRCFRGNVYDVLDRYYQAARWVNADVVVRITADCPMIDPQVIDNVVREFLASGADFGCNRLPPPWKRTYPIGLDVEICTFAALERAWQEAEIKYEREHVMPYLYDQPGRFKVLVVDAEDDQGALRWTVDTPQDLAMLREFWALLGNRDDFSWREALAVYQAHPELAEMNAAVQHKRLTDVDQRFEKPEEDK